jgi:hypothetical protein
MTNDGRELRRDLGVAPGRGGRGQTVTVEDRNSPVRRTSRSRWREVDFRFEGHHELRGLEQNPEAASRWGQLAREGKKGMQFLSERLYIAVVVAGTVQF